LRQKRKKSRGIKSINKFFNSRLESMQEGGSSRSLTWRRSLWVALLKRRLSQKGKTDYHNFKKGKAKNTSKKGSSSGDAKKTLKKKARDAKYGKKTSRRGAKLSQSNSRKEPSGEVLGGGGTEGPKIGLRKKEGVEKTFHNRARTCWSRGDQCKVEEVVWKKNKQGRSIIAEGGKPIKF